MSIWKQACSTSNKVIKKKKRIPLRSPIIALYLRLRNRSTLIQLLCFQNKKQPWGVELSSKNFQDKIPGNFFLWLCLRTFDKTFWLRSRARQLSEPKFSLFVPILLSAFSRYVPLTAREKSNRVKFTKKKKIYFLII